MEMWPPRPPLISSGGSFAGLRVRGNPGRTASGELRRLGESLWLQDIGLCVCQDSFSSKDRNPVQTSSAQQGNVAADEPECDSQAGRRATGTQGLGLSVLHRTTGFLTLPLLSCVSFWSVSVLVCSRKVFSSWQETWPLAAPVSRSPQREKTTHSRGGLPSALFELCTQSLCLGGGHSYWPGVRLRAHSRSQSAVQGNYK